MTSMRNCIEELPSLVMTGKHAGQSIPDLQRTITVASLKAPLTLTLAQAAVNAHILQMYHRVDLK